MSLISNLLLKQRFPLKQFPSLIRSQTSSTIDEAKAVLHSQVTHGTNWSYPDGRTTLEAVDQVSNECCRLIDSALILYKNFSDGDKPLQEALVDSMNAVNDFFGSEYLNQNKRLLTILQAVYCSPVQ